MGSKHIITLIILIGVISLMLRLGFWQLQRLEWKEGIITKIEAQESIDPMVTALDLAHASDFSRGYLKGRFLTGKPSILVGPRTSEEGMSGFHVMHPFRTTAGDEILVNLGWISARQKDTTYILPQAVIKIAGYLQSPAEQGTFTPTNYPDQNLWYWVDLPAMGAMYDREKLFPMVLYLENPVILGIQPFYGLPHPRNKHVQYAAFWFGMAGLLVILCGVYAWRNKRKTITE